MEDTTQYIFPEEYQWIREYMALRRGWFGLKWDTVVRKEAFGDELRLTVHRIPQKVFINEKEYVLKKKK